MRKEELSAISGPNEFAEFYNRLKHIKEFHRKHPNEVVTWLKWLSTEPVVIENTRLNLLNFSLWHFFNVQICVPMSVEFEELIKARDNPSEEAQSKSQLTRSSQTFATCMKLLLWSIAWKLNKTDLNNLETTGLQWLLTWVHYTISFSCKCLIKVDLYCSF